MLNALAVNGVVIVQAVNGVVAVYAVNGVKWFLRLVNGV